MRIQLESVEMRFYVPKKFLLGQICGWHAGKAVQYNDARCWVP